MGAHVWAGSPGGSRRGARAALRPRRAACWRIDERSCVGWKSWSQGCFKAEEGCLLADTRAVMCGLEVLEDGGGEPRLL